MDAYAVFQGLAQTLKDNLSATVNGRGITALPYCPDSVSEPCVFVAEFDVDFDGAMKRGKDSMTVTVRALFSRTDDMSAAKAVAAMFSGSGPYSIKEALEKG